jgi:hypothetical protein
MLHLRTAMIALGILFCGLLVGCNQQTTPSASQPAENKKPATEPTKSGTDMPDMPGMSESEGEESSPSSGATMDAQHMYAGGAHQDHNAKHGGTFFMGLDNRHHLEGTLVPPDLFRVYIYDAYTHPVSAEELGKVQATVIWGEQDGAPEIDMKPNAEETAFEAQAPEPIQFPLTLTLLVRFPGESPTARPELFTFPFSHYSHGDTTPHDHPMGQ